MQTFGKVHIRDAGISFHLANRDLTPSQRVKLIFDRWGGYASKAFKNDVYQHILAAMRQAQKEV